MPFMHTEAESQMRKHVPTAVVFGAPERALFADECVYCNDCNTLLKASQSK